MADNMPRKKKSTDPAPAVEAGKKDNLETETKREKLPLYGSFTAKTGDRLSFVIHDDNGNTFTGMISFFYRLYHII